MSTQCPFCERCDTRAAVHLHMVEDHADRFEAWRDAESGRMHYRVECPICDDHYEKRVKPRSRDPRFLEEFASEVRMVGFDMLLNHVQAEHGEPSPDAGQTAAAPLPAAGPAGGRGRPGAGGVPLPPGMGEQDVRGPAVYDVLEAHKQNKEET